MTYNIGDKVLILTKIVQKIENEDGVSYDVVTEDPKRTIIFNTLRIKDKDIIVNRG